MKNKIVLLFILFSTLSSAQYVNKLIKDRIAQFKSHQEYQIEKLQEPIRIKEEAEQWVYEFLPHFLEEEFIDQSMIYLIQAVKIPNKTKNYFLEKTDTLTTNALLLSRIKELRDKFGIVFSNWVNDYNLKNINFLYESLLEKEDEFKEIKKDVHKTKADKMTLAHLEYGKHIQNYQRFIELKDRLVGEYHRVQIMRVEAADERILKLYNEIIK